MNTTSATTQVTPDKLIELGMGFWASQALLSAVDLGVFTALAKGACKEKELVQRIGINGRGARDFFDALVALHVLERDGDLYRNTPETDRFLDKTKDSYIGGILTMSNARLWPSWGKLATGLRTGQPQGEGKGQDDKHFDHVYSNPEKVRQFAEAMTGISTATAAVIAQKFQWSDYKTFCDIGCAQGALPVRLAMAHPHLTGIGMDLEVIRPIFDQYAASFNLQKRLRFEARDIFKDSLPSADVYVLGHMLHGWDLASKKAIVKKVHESLPKGGALIVFDAMIDDERRKNAFGLLMSLNMLLESEGGFDYTVGEGQKWLKEAGFRDVSATHLNGPDSMVVGLK